jgi:hypothetical protein
MANINVNDLIDLNLAGVDLLNDPESFMKDLNEESEQVIGGCNTSVRVECRLPTCYHTHRHCELNTSRVLVDYAMPDDQLIENFNP